VVSSLLKKKFSDMPFPSIARSFSNTVKVKSESIMNSPQNVVITLWVLIIAIACKSIFSKIFLFADPKISLYRYGHGLFFAYRWKVAHVALWSSFRILDENSRIVHQRTLKFVL
jgi:hypothetical protein